MIRRKRPTYRYKPILLSAVKHLWTILPNLQILEFIFGFNVRYCFKVGQYSVKLQENTILIVYIR